MEERVELDRLRHRYHDGKDAEPVVDRTEGELRLEPVRGPPALSATFNGVIHRSDGHRVAWVDGVETAEGETTRDGVRIDAVHTSGGRLHIRLSHGRTSTVLEPGQFAGDGGRAREAYESRIEGAAGGNFGKHEADSETGARAEDAVASAGLPRWVPSEARGTNLVPPSSPRARAGASAHGTGVLHVQPAGDGMHIEGAPVESDSGS